MWVLECLGYTIDSTRVYQLLIKKPRYNYFVQVDVMWKKINMLLFICFHQKKKCISEPYLKGSLTYLVLHVRYDFWHANLYLITWIKGTHDQINHRFSFSLWIKFCSLVGVKNSQMQEITFIMASYFHLFLLKHCILKNLSNYGNFIQILSDFYCYNWIDFWKYKPL